MRIINHNFIQDGVTTLTASSSDVNFPVSNLLSERRSKVWRSSGSFTVTSTNKYIDFKDASAGPEITATVPEGTYTVNALGLAIKTAMELVGGQIYTVSYGSSTGLWTLASDGAEFELLGATGTNSASNLLTTSLGFGPSDLSGLTSYTGVNIAIHTEEYIDFDIQSIEPINSVAVLMPQLTGFELSNAAQIYIQANATPVFTSPAVNQILTIDNNYSMATHYFETDQMYRYWRIKIIDPSNLNLYVSLGILILGESVGIRNPERGFDFNIQDPSRVSTTDYGHRYTDILPKRRSVKLDFNIMSYSEITILEQMWMSNGISKPVFITMDHDETIFDKDQFSIYGKFQPSLRLSHINYDIFSSGLNIEEIA